MNKHNKKKTKSALLRKRYTKRQLKELDKFGSAAVNALNAGIARNEKENQ